MSSWLNMDTLKGLGQQVQGAIPSNLVSDGGEMLKKLTLTSTELKAERERIDVEERRKEQVRDMLAGMLPWETRDPERDILVEECKEAILKLSSDRDVFFGPYEMPKASVNLETVDSAEEEEGNDDDELKIAATESTEASKSRMPSEDSIEKLKTLEPLPPLLQDFDLDTHVGLIQNLLKEDPKLVEMQSTLSGGGEHEKVFWRNYFFHCAWCRYEAGLSIDEIWSEDQPPPPASSDAANPADGTETGESEEETITFNKPEDETPPEKAFAADPQTDPDAPFSSETDKEASASSASGGVVTSTSNSVTAEFEMVGGSEGNTAEDTIDYELDELEAEIAKELED